MAEEFTLTPPTGPLVEPEYHEQGVKVYEMGDQDEWWAGYDLESCVTAALAQWGGPRSDYFEEGDPADSPCNLDTTMINLDEDDDPNGRKAPYRQHLKTLIEAAEAFPCFFAGRDF